MILYKQCDDCEEPDTCVVANDTIDKVVML